MPNLIGRFLKEAARQTEALTRTPDQRAMDLIQQARTEAQQAMPLVQEAMTTRTQQEVQAALAAMAKVVTDAATAAKAAQGLVLAEQRRAQGKLPATLDYDASESIQATAELADQVRHASVVVAMDSSGRTAQLHIGRASEIMANVESVLSKVSMIVQGTVAAKTAYDHEHRQELALAQKRKKYLAPFGGIDPEEIMDQVKNGSYPSVPAGIILHKGEVALCAMPSALAEDKTTRTRVGGYSGYSMPIGFGVRFRVGTYQGRTISHEQLTKVDQGTVIVTTQRIVFNGSRRTVAIPLSKVVNTVLYRDGVDVRAENHMKREVFQCRNARRLNAFILTACQLA